MFKKSTVKRAAALLFALVILMTVPLTAHAKNTEQKKVRVGWFASSYNSLDERGRRSGYFC